MPNNDSNTTRRYHDNLTFCRKLTFVLVSTFVIFMAIIAIAWLVMHPKEPSFGVTSLSVTNFTLTNSKFKGKYEVELAITNPNKVKVEVVVHRISKLVLYGTTWCMEAAVQPRVVVEKMANESVKVESEVVQCPPKKVVVVPEDLVKEWNKGVLNFNVEFSVIVKFEAGILPSMDKLLDVSCENLDLGFFNPKDTGKLLGIGKNCNIADEEKA